eukprot:7089497-Alexandrium_andersonii.AAC.1
MVIRVICPNFKDQGRGSVQDAIEALSQTRCGIFQEYVYHFGQGQVVALRLLPLAGGMSAGVIGPMLVEITMRALDTAWFALTGRDREALS